MPDCPVPEHGDIIRYWSAPVPDWNDECRNSNAGGIGLYADAQLCKRTQYVLLISKYKKAHLKLDDRQNILSENPWRKVDDKPVKLRPHSCFCYFISALKNNLGKQRSCFDIINKNTPAPLIVPYTKAKLEVFSQQLPLDVHCWRVQPRTRHWEHSSQVPEDDF